MAYADFYWFGGTVSDFVVDVNVTAVEIVPDATGTVFTAETGGTQVTGANLVDAAESPWTDNEIVADELGNVPVFGIDRDVVLTNGLAWVNFGGGRIPLTPRDLAERLAAVESDGAAISDGDKGDVLVSGDEWTVDKHQRVIYWTGAAWGSARDATWPAPVSYMSLTDEDATAPTDPEDGDLWYRRPGAAPL